MTVYSLEQTLADTEALIDAATTAGITPQQARALAAAFADMPMGQVVRICTSARGSADRSRLRRERHGGP